MASFVYFGLTVPRDSYILRTIYCVTGAAAYNTWSKITTGKSAAELGNKVRQSSSTATFR